MKNNNRKQSVTFLTILSFLTISASSAIAAIEPSSKREFATPRIEQQSQTKTQKTEKPLELNTQDNHETWEKVELEQEWEDVANNESEDGILIIAAGRQPV